MALSWNSAASAVEIFEIVATWPERTENKDGDIPLCSNIKKTCQSQNSQWRTSPINLLTGTQILLVSALKEYRVRLVTDNVLKQLN